MHKHLPLFFVHYNTSYHTSMGCEPTRVFHGRVLYNIFDHELGFKFDPNLKVTTDFVDEQLRRTQISYNKTKKNVMQTYVKYKSDFEEKTRDCSYKINTFVRFYNLKRTTMDQKFLLDTSDGLFVMRSKKCNSAINTSFDEST